MKRITALTSDKMYMFTLFKESMLILVCICIVIPSKLLKPADYVYTAKRKEASHELPRAVSGQSTNDGYLSALHLSFASSTTNKDPRQQQNIL